MKHYNRIDNDEAQTFVELVLAALKTVKEAIGNATANVANIKDLDDRRLVVVKDETEYAVYWTGDIFVQKGKSSFSTLTPFDARIEGQVASVIKKATGDLVREIEAAYVDKPTAVALAVFAGKAADKFTEYFDTKLVKKAVVALDGKTEIGPVAANAVVTVHDDKAIKAQAKTLGIKQDVTVESAVVDYNNVDVIATITWTDGEKKTKVLKVGTVSDKEFKEPSRSPGESGRAGTRAEPSGDEESRTE